MKKRLCALLALVLAATLVLTGCGGDAKGKSTITLRAVEIVTDAELATEAAAETGEAPAVPDEN